MLLRYGHTSSRNIIVACEWYDNKQEASCFQSGLNMWGGLPGRKYYKLPLYWNQLCMISVIFMMFISNIQVATIQMSYHMGIGNELIPKNIVVKRRHHLQIIATLTKTRTEHHTKYHGQTLDGVCFQPIHWNTLPDRPNMSFKLEKVHYCQQYQAQQRGGEEQIILAYLNIVTPQCQFSPEPSLFQCCDHFYIESVPIH